MAKLAYLHDKVQAILEKDEVARGSDAHLYCVLAESLSPNVTYKPFRRVLMEADKFGLPSIETVGRVRRKVQELNPRLRPADAVKKYRTDNEELMRQYARNEVR